MANCNVNIIVASAVVKLGVDLHTAQWVKEVVTRGIRYQSFLVILLRFWKSTPSCRIPSLFLEKRIGALAGDWDDWMNPLPSIWVRNSQRRPGSVPESE